MAESTSHGGRAGLASTAVTVLKQEAAISQRNHMERSISEDFRVAKEDLKEAAEHSPNVIMNLSLDGVVRFVTPSWQEVVGTPSDSVVGKPIADVLVENKDAFGNAIAELQRDDSRSQLIRFTVAVGPLSSYRRKMHRSKEVDATAEPTSDSFPESDATLSLEAQGIMVYDRASGGESNTMWQIRPYVVREVTIDLPDMLVESLGIGAEMLAQYLTELAEAGVSDPANHPPPLPVLCRICERQITPWWFEKHSELCLQEHTAEMDVQLAQESLAEQRSEIVKVLDGLDAQTRQPRAPVSGESALPAPSPPEYKGYLIGPASTPSSGLSSGRVSPASPSRSRDRSSTSFGHNRARSFAVRRPLARIVELVLDLCDTALEISTPALTLSRNQQDGEFRTQSPQSESRVSQVLQWNSPSTSTVENEQGLAMLCEDTARLARIKVDAISRHRHILEYSERIRIEFAVLVQECIEAAMDKAARIAAGEISDSSDDTEGQDLESQAEMMRNDMPADDRASEEGMFPGSFEAHSAMSTALRNSSNPSFDLESKRRPSSAATSTRSSSPRGSKTPRSHASVANLPPPSKRGSIYFESDTGADSDSSILSSAMSVTRRAESPGSDMSLSRVHSSRDRKRKSLILPSLSSRQHSPARSIPQVPSSPLRMAKARKPSDSQSSQSPITSPVLSTSEFSSPAIIPQHVQQHHHRRQSSAASSEVFRQPSSPRLAPVSNNPQPRAVPPSIKDFEIIKPISKGAFGSVYLAKKKSTGDYFAIKVLRKADMVAKNQVTNVKAERAIMMWQGESDFVAKLYWTFSSKDYLYLVMEYLNGGDCASLIKVLGGLPEEWSKKYVAEVVLGVEHLHSRGIVHRDLKPDNLLIDQKGHLKLTDFGLSRMGLVGRQKRALNSKDDELPAPDLLKQGASHRVISVGSSRSASFDLPVNYSPSQTPSLFAPASEIAQPSYFSLTRDINRKTSAHKTESETSDGLNTMLRRFSLAEDNSSHQAQSPIEEESGSGETCSPEFYALQSVPSHPSALPNNAPLASSGIMPPTMALFDPQDTSRKFVGTPDYLAPETINGIGQDEVSDWWSLGCIIFEVLYGYPPFHGESPEEVFQNILAHRIDWPPEGVCPVSPEAKDVMNRLMCPDPSLRLGANAEEKFESGGEEIRKHPWFVEINWESLREDEASFVPAPENPEDTEYFDARGATLQSFAAEFEDQGASSVGTPGADYHERPHDALSRVRSQVNSIKRGLMPLHIPPHVRDGRTRRLSEPVATDDFGSFSFKNLPVLEKANKDVIQKLRAEALQAQHKPAGSAVPSAAVSVSTSPLLESSPILPMPVQRTVSSSKGTHRPASPSVFGQPSASPSRISQPSSPLLVQFSAGQGMERRKASSSSSTLSHQGSHSLQPGNFFDAPRMMGNVKSTSSASSPIKLAKSPVASFSHERSMSAQKLNGPCGKVASARPRSHTVSSQESEDIVKDLVPKHHKRRSQVMEVSPSSSDNEDSRQKAAFLRVQRRRQSSRRMSQITLDQGPMFRPLDVLVCEDHPVSRLVMEKLLEKHRCRTITAQSGPEAMRYALSEVKFDIIMMEYKLPQINGADVARMIRDTKNVNTNTPIVCVTGYLKELPPSHHFDGLIDKPPTLQKLADIMSRLCQWKPPPAGWMPSQYASMPLSGLRQESARTEDSPNSTTSSYGANMPSGSYRGSSREDSISSSFFGDTDSRIDDVPVTISKHSSEDWHDKDLAQALDGLGIIEGAFHELDGKSTIPSLSHQQSAPAAMEHSVPRRVPSAERIDEKRRSIEKKRRDSAESGDDEDEELGNAQLRTKSPLGGRPRGTSKLGTEMMRTNSRGSVVSVDDISHTEPLINSLPPIIAEERRAEEAAQESPDSKHISITPPELFPRLPGAAVEDIDMDVATPKPQHIESLDPDPTPKSSASFVDY